MQPLRKRTDNANEGTPTKAQLDQGFFQKEQTVHSSKQRSVPPLNLPVSKVLPINSSSRVSSEKQQQNNDDMSFDEGEEQVSQLTDNQILNTQR